MLHATSAAVWRLRRDILGYRAADPTITDPMLISYLIASSDPEDVPRGFDARRLAREEWSHQRERLARVFLVNLISLYESWLQSTLEQFSGHPCVTTQDREDDAVPVRGVYGTVRRDGGIGEGLSRLEVDSSKVMKNVFADKLLAHHSATWSRKLRHPLPGIRENYLKSNSLYTDTSRSFAMRSPSREALAL